MLSLRTATVSALLTCLLLAAGASRLDAQAQHPNLARGFQAENTYQLGDVDHVNLMNGNLVVTIPIGPSFALDAGGSYRLNLIYNSKLWDFDENSNAGIEVAAARDSNAGFGWQLHFGRLISPNALPRNDRNHWLYLASDGSEHYFYSTLHNHDAATANVFYTRDGSYLRLRLQTNGTAEIDSPTGILHRFDSQGRMIARRDPYGNGFSVSYEGSRWLLSDTAGRQHIVRTTNLSMDGAVRPIVTQVDLDIAGPSAGLYALRHTQRSIERPCPSLQPINTPTASVPVLTRVDQPQGTAWEMPAYQLTRGASCKSTGVLERMKTPTRGSLRYEYGPYARGTGVGERLREVYSSSAGVTRRVWLSASGANLGEWRYTPQLTPGAPSTGPGEPNQPVEGWTDVVSPLGDTTRHYFSMYLDGPLPASGADSRAKTWMYGLPFTTRQVNDRLGVRHFLSTEVRDGGVVKRRTWVAYERDPTNGPNPFTLSDAPPGTVVYNRRPYSQLTEFLDDGARWAMQKSEEFDGFGNHRKTRTWGSVAIGASEDQSVRYTRTNPGRNGYPHVALPSPSAPWLLHLYDQQWTEQTGGAAGRDYQEFCFEAHTGHLKASRVRAEAGQRRSHDRIHRRVRTPQGSIANERFLGGDLNAVGTGDLCAMFADESLADPPALPLPYAPADYAPPVPRPDDDDAPGDGEPGDPGREEPEPGREDPDGGDDSDGERDG
ncbi:MAG: hypothetical protein AAF772_08695 [Acidobacteriota bacterium]